MSRLFEALQRMDMKDCHAELVTPMATEPVDSLSSIMEEAIDLAVDRSVEVEVSRTSRLVALTDPNGLGAEKFRALATRLEYLRQRREMKSLQVTSSTINEGKTLVAANLAVTLATYSGSKILLIEGDFHRPTLSSLLGLTHLQGLSHWWSGRGQDIARYVHRLNDTTLWFLSAGEICDQPSQIMQSAVFAEAFNYLVGKFDWVIVDSTPMSPTVVANLWSRRVDGTLLVVREGVASVKTLKRGLQALDNPKLIGIVLNEASDVDRTNYAEQYCTTAQQTKIARRKRNKSEAVL
jgi:capsular exopolysaccharide synthesis family protein